MKVGNLKEEASDFVPPSQREKEGCGCASWELLLTSLSKALRSIPNVTDTHKTLKPAQMKWRRREEDKRLYEEDRIFDINEIFLRIIKREKYTWAWC